MCVHDHPDARNDGNKMAELFRLVVSLRLASPAAVYQFNMISR